MRFRRRLPILFGVLLVAAAIAIVVFLRKHAPPEAARLLPQADGFLYLNLKDLRRAGVPGQLPPVSHDPEYEQFIEATGFQFENDLDEAAFAIHYPTRDQPQLRYSEVFIGKIQVQRLRDYLQKIAKSVDTYRSVDLYTIPIEDRTFRVAILGVDAVAATNLSDPHVLEGMIDRSRKLASPFGGPALLRKYYKYVPISTRYVPFASLGWSVFRVDPAAENAAAGPLGLSLLFSKPAVIVASVGHVRNVRFRAEAFTDDEDEAKHVADQLHTFLAVFHSAEANLSKAGPDPDIRTIFESLEVKQSGDRTVLTASIPATVIQRALAGPPDGSPLDPVKRRPKQ